MDGPRQREGAEEIMTGGRKDAAWELRADQLLAENICKLKIKIKRYHAGCVSRIIWLLVRGKVKVTTRWME
jgi:hypothetical protein